MQRNGPATSRNRWVAIADSSALFAAADRDEREHARCLAVFQRSDLRFVIPAIVVAETTYFIEKWGGPSAEAAFLRSLADYEVEAPLTSEWERIAELVERYANFPIGGTDASIVALAERLETDLVVTLDRRHFAAIQPKHVDGLRLLPE